MNQVGLDNLDLWAHGVAMAGITLGCLMILTAAADVVARCVYVEYRAVPEVLKLRVVTLLSTLMMVVLTALNVIYSLEIGRLSSACNKITRSLPSSHQERAYPWPIQYNNFSYHCQTNFNLTGNGPHELAFVPRILWARCLDDNYVLDFSALDIGLCYGDTNGTLVEQPKGFFNTSCLDCSRDPYATMPTLFCHCETPNPHNASEIHKYLYTSIDLDQTIQVYNGVLACLGGNGTRGGEPPKGIGY